jgi:hypothetical protein
MFCAAIAMQASGPMKIVVIISNRFTLSPDAKVGTKNMKKWMKEDGRKYVVGANGRLQLMWPHAPPLKEQVRSPQNASM